MKITVERDTLAPALDAAMIAARTNTGLPIHSCLLLQASGGGLTIGANDRDSCIEVRLTAEVAKPGAIAVFADTLRSLVKSTPEGAQIVIESDPDKPQAALKMGRSRYALPMLPADDFPATFDFTAPDVAEFVLAADEASRLLDRPRSCCAKGKTMLMMQGLWLSHREDRLWSFGLDGYVLMALSIPAPEGLGPFTYKDGMGIDKPGIVVPTAALNGLLKALEHGGTLSTDGNIVVAQSPTMRFASKLLMNQFPDAWNAIPAPSGNRFMVDRGDFNAALKRIGAMSGKTPKLFLNVAAGADAVTMALRDGVKGSGEEYTSIGGGGAEDIKFEVNHDYMVNLLSLLSGDTVAMSLGKGAYAELLRIEDLSDPDILMCVAGFKEGAGA